MVVLAWEVLAVVVAVVVLVLAVEEVVVVVMGVYYGTLTDLKTLSCSPLALML